MHEASLAESIIKTAAQHANGAKIKTVSLVVGDSAGVMCDSLCMYFDIFAENTPCKGASIEIETVLPKLQCKACGSLFIRKPFLFECECGGEGRPTDIGREFYIKSITIEECMAE